MIGRVIAKIVVWALKSKTLSLQQKTECTNALLRNLFALPIRNTIIINEQGTLLINGRAVDREKAMQLRESSIATLESQARKLVKEQVAYLAINQGVHVCNTPEQMIFAKAALWFSQEEDKLYNLLAGRED